MKIVFNCVVCGSPDIRKKIGQFAPFIAHRVFDYPVCRLNFGDQALFPMLLTNSIRCNRCGFVFSQLRPDDDEMSRIYKDYRGDEYARVRDLFEPGYAAVNLLIGNSPTEINNRQAALAEFLNGEIDVSVITRVLDYGGDRGQHIPRVFDTCDRYVYDISNIAAEVGVKAINSLENFGTADFVIAANIMEHVSYPEDIVREVRKLSKNTTFIFVDVPLEMDDTVDIEDARIPAMFHEHINYFTTKSLRVLLQCNGLQVQKLQVVEVDLGRHKARSIYALARPSW